MGKKRGHPTSEQQRPVGQAIGSSFAPVHGAYTLQRQIVHGVLDGRTKIARAMKSLRRELHDHVGGSPTITQSLLVERVVNKLPVLEAMEQYRLLLNKDIDVSSLSGDELLEAYKLFIDAGLDARYKSFCDSFRADLIALGLRRPLAPVKELSEYIESKSK